jgi:hypothetical protein
MTSIPDINVLAAALDRILPAVDNLAGAGEMGLGQEVIDRSRADSRFWDALSTVTEALSSSGDFVGLDRPNKDEVLRNIEESDASAFGLWLDVVYTIYYMQPAVHTWLNWHGRPPQPEGNVMPPWDDSILEVARKREPFWRKV